MKRHLRLIEGYQHEADMEHCFGICPDCFQMEDMLNVERVHLGVCHTHRQFWRVGENLFSGWRDQDPREWDRNSALLQTYRSIESADRCPDCRGGMQP